MMESHHIESLNLETDQDSLSGLTSPGSGKSLSAQVVFGAGSVRSSASLDSLATLYDSNWPNRQRASSKKVNRTIRTRTTDISLSRPVPWVCTSSGHRGG